MKYKYFIIFAIISILLITTLSSAYAENDDISPSIEESDTNNESFGTAPSDESIDNSEEQSNDESSDNSFDVSEAESKDESDITYSINIKHTSGGTVIANKTSAKSGETIVLQITEDSGYKLLSITVNGKVLTSNTFIMPASDVEIVAAFEKIGSDESKNDISSKSESSRNENSSATNDESRPTSNGTSKYYNITSSVTGKGTVAFDKTSATSGTRVIVTVKPDAGYKLEYIEFNEKKITEIGEKYAFVMPATNVTVKAYFVKMGTESNTSNSESLTSSPSSEMSTNESMIDSSVGNSSGIIEISNIADESLIESEINDVSTDDKNASSPLLFIIPIIIILGMIGSGTVFFIRKNNKTL